MKKLISLFLALILSLSLCVPALAADDYAKLQELSDLVRDYSLAYKDSDADPLLNALESLMEKDPTLFRKLADEMLEGLDKYSHYMTADEYEAAFPRGVAYVGVGISVDPAYPYGVVVESLVDGGSAEEAGLLPGDVIVTVDGTSVELLPYSEAVSQLRGESGTSAVVLVRRQGQTGLLEFKLERRGLSLPNVTYENLGNGVAVITISRFETIIDFFDFVDIYNTLPYETDVKSVVIDLRGNPGGDVAVTFNMLNYMVRERRAALFELVNSQEDEVYYSTGAGLWTPNEMIIVVDETSASASEIFAGSLQSLGYAKVLGQPTYGKGRSQYHIALEDDSIAIITAYEILLPEGKSYDTVGLTPDYLIEQQRVPYTLPEMFALDTNNELKPNKKYSAQALALQQRLKVLGIFPGEPDGIYDDLTIWSVNVFQKAMKLTVRTYADKNTLTAINREVDNLTKLEITLDTQMETALKLAEEAAKKPWTNPPVEQTEW